MTNKLEHTYANRLTVGSHLDAIGKRDLTTKNVAWKELHNKNIIITSLENLINCANINYDMIVLDEVETILCHYQSSTMIKKTEDDEGYGFNFKTWEAFKDAIFNCNSVIALDANITNHRVKLLDSLVKDKYCGCKFRITLCSTNRFSEVKRRIWFSKKQFDNALY